jgi:sulfate transport system ATP-binding protein
MNIAIQNLTKRFGSFTALNDVSLSIPSGELVALLGPSGSGKTTLLRIVAGLEAADRGQVLFDGEDATARRLRERNVGFVFQHYALFRHMTVGQNVAFGLKVRPRRTRPSRRQIKDRVAQLLNLVQLDRLAERYPSQLSGGQRQRVALARALAVEPKVLLLDEPFGALDAKVRKDLRRWLRRLHDEIHITSVFVTHDQEEALEVADRVVVMNEGRIEQVGSAEDVYHRPANPFVYNFLGDVNLFHGRVDGAPVYLDALQSDLTVGTAPSNKQALIFVRPHLLDIHLDDNGDEGFFARIDYINPARPLVKIELFDDAEQPIQVELSQERYRQLDLKKNMRVFVTAKEKQVFVQDYVI